MSAATEEPPVTGPYEESLVVAAAPSNSLESSADEVQFLKDAVRSLPSQATAELVSLGVCVRCIFRLFGIGGNTKSVYSFADSVLGAIVEEASLPSKFEIQSESCRVCFGILQFIFRDEKRALVKKESAIDMARCMAELVKHEGYEIDSFSVEVSIPQLIGELEATFWLDIRSRFGSEIWFQENSLSHPVSIKDALKFALAGPLEDLLNVKSDTISLRVRLTYTHPKGASRAQSSVKRGQNGKRQKTGNKGSSNLDYVEEETTNCTSLRWFTCYLSVERELSKSICIRITDKIDLFSLLLELIDGLKGVPMNACQGVKNGSDYNPKIGCTEAANSSTNGTRAVEGSIDCLHDSENSESPGYRIQEENEPCCLELSCYMMPIFLGGRYLKYSRNVSQTRWIIDDERMGEASVEEIIGSNILSMCRCDDYKFHAAGREDIDVRMLGSGRPFLIEIQNPRQVPPETVLKDIEEKINNLETKLVSVKNIKVVSSQGWELMREGEAEKQKQYAALVWISRPLEDKDLQSVSSLKDIQIIQRTPVRVLHRRSSLEREKTIHWMKIEKIAGSSQYFLLHLCTQAGTYIKEFVHGDLGRTQPSIGSILQCRAEILQLDVTDVKMDCF